MKCGKSSYRNTDSTAIPRFNIPDASIDPAKLYKPKNVVPYSSPERGIGMNYANQAATMSTYLERQRIGQVLYKNVSGN